ncbi:MAG: ATP-binding cassette domain-containing protein [Cytophagales bacterium]|nr:MAG: ATP-binding cassette domain-containing protein [Cytophagales bacterium]
MSKQELNEEDKKRKIRWKDFKQTFQIFRFIVPYRWHFVAGMLFLVLSTLTALSFPYFAGRLVDASQHKTAQSIQEIALVLLFILATQAIFSFFRILLFTYVSEKALKDVRNALYQKMICLPMTFFEQRRVGELNSRLSADVTQLQDVLSFTLAEFFRQIATLIIGISVLLFTSLQLTLLMISTFPVLIIVAIFFGRYIRTFAKKSQDILAESATIVEETLQAISVVKSFANEKYEAERYNHSLQSLLSMALRTAQLRGFFVSFIIFALFGAIVLVLWYGAFMVEQNLITIGELTSFIIYTAFIGGAVGGMGELYAQLQRTVGASERILEILAEKTESEQDNPLAAPIDIQGDIVYENVAFAYPTRPDVEVLKNISLRIASGQKVALVGHSGAGKSTIVQLLNRFYALEKGSISIDHQNIQNYSIHSLRRQIGVVPQDIILFGGTIADNIRYGKPEATEEEIVQAAQKAHAWQFISQFPEGLKTIVGERGIKLSGGQRQRIAIARAILKNPSILILDEATSSLDAESEQAVQEALDTLMQNRTTIIIAHRLATIRKVDTIYVINDGQIVEQGTHESLILQEKGIYSHLVKLQFEAVNES